MDGEHRLERAPAQPMSADIPLQAPEVIRAPARLPERDVMPRGAGGVAVATEAGAPAHRAHDEGNGYDSKKGAESVHARKVGALTGATADARRDPFPARSVPLSAPLPL